MTLPFPTSAVPPLALELRPYQREAIDALFSWFENCHGNPLVVIPTGGGKSLCLAGFIHRALSLYPTERILILTHVKELISQNHAQMLRCWPGAPAGIYSAGIGRREHDAPILFAGIQSVWKKAAQIGWVDLVMVDECHLVGGDGLGMYRTLLAALASMNSNLKVIGLTATPFRTGEGSLHQGNDRLFHGIAYSADLRQLIADGYLSPVVSRGTSAPIPTEGVHKQAGDFVGKELEAAALSEELVKRAVAEIVSRGAERKAWLVFCCGIAHAKAVAAELAAAGITTACVFGETKPAERDAIVADYKAGKIRCVVNVSVLTTGFDAPHIDLIALLRPTLSPGLFVQMVGRGLRLAPGKANALVLDFGGNVARHGPIDCVRIDEPRGKNEDALAEEPAGKECPSCRLLVAAAVRQCPDCGYEWPAPAPYHDTTPDEESELISAPHPTGGIERWNVQQVFYRRHERGGKTPTLCAEYRCGFHQTARQWICFEHDGFPRRKAESWWKANGGTLPVPETVDLALVRIECGELVQAASITVDVRGEWPEIKSVRAGQREPGESSDGAEAAVPPDSKSPDYGDIPF